MEDKPQGSISPMEKREARTSCFTKVPVLGFKMAPVNIPMSRRLQTFSVLFWMSYFLFSGLIGTGITLYILLFTRFWYLSVLYLSFIYWDFDTMNRGGRRGWILKWVRNWPLWRHFCNFFPIKIVKTAELDPKQNYLLGSHPHGILCTGAVGAFGTEGADFQKIFPGITPKVLTLSVQFWFPLHRELAYCLGGCCASKKGMRSLLTSEEKGVATVLVPGGARESLNGDKDRIRLVLNNRKGFIKMALETGVSLVPTFSFGEMCVYDLYPNPPGSWVRRLQDFVLSKTTVPLFFFMGRGVFQYSMGIVPFRHPIHVVVGAPIPVSKSSSPTTEEVESLHAVYVKALKDLYKEYNPKYGEPGVELVVE